MTDRKPYAPASRIQLREAFYATKPTAWTCYLRTSLPWQLVRFAVINLRMIRIIGLSHRGRG